MRVISHHAFLASVGFLLVGNDAAGVFKVGTAVLSCHYVGTGMKKHPRATLPFLLGLAAFGASLWLTRHPKDWKLGLRELPYVNPVMMAMWWKLFVTANYTNPDDWSASAAARAAAIETWAAVRYCLLDVPAGFFLLGWWAILSVVDAAKLMTDADRNRRAAPLPFRRGANVGDEEVDDESADSNNVARGVVNVGVRRRATLCPARAARLPVLFNHSLNVYEENDDADEEVVDHNSRGTGHDNIRFVVTDAGYTHSEISVPFTSPGTASSEPTPSSQRFLNTTTTTTSNSGGSRLASWPAAYSTTSSTSALSHAIAANASASTNRFLPPVSAVAQLQQHHHHQQQQQQFIHRSHGLGIQAAAIGRASESPALVASHLPAGSEAPTNVRNDKEVPLQPKVDSSDGFSDLNSINSLGSAHSPAAVATSVASAPAPATLLPDGETQDGIGPVAVGVDISNPLKRKSRPESSTIVSSKPTDIVIRKASKADAFVEENETREPPAKRHCPSTRIRASGGEAALAGVVALSSSSDDESLSRASSADSLEGIGPALHLMSLLHQQPEEVSDDSSRKPAAKKSAPTRAAGTKSVPKKATMPTIKTRNSSSKASAKHTPASAKRDSNAVLDEDRKPAALRRSSRSTRRI